MMDFDLIGLTDIADMLGVKRETPGIWRYRGVLLEPDLVVGRKPMWLRERVVAWARETGRWPNDS